MPLVFRDLPFLKFPNLISFVAILKSTMETRGRGRGRGRGRINTNIALYNDVLNDDDPEPLNFDDIMSDIRQTRVSVRLEAINVMADNNYIEFEDIVNQSSPNCFVNNEANVTDEIIVISSNNTTDNTLVTPLADTTDSAKLKKDFAEYEIDQDLLDNKGRVKSIACNESNEVEKMMLHYAKRSNDAVALSVFNQNLYTYICCLCAHSNYGDTVKMYELYLKYAIAFKGFMDCLLLDSYFVINVCDNAQLAFGTETTKKWSNEFLEFVSSLMKREPTREFKSNQVKSWIGNAGDTMIANAYFGM
jgi:uncharacterized protein YifN (PemK superfamily)